MGGGGAAREDVEQLDKGNDIVYRRISQDGVSSG